MTTARFASIPSGERARKGMTMNRVLVAFAALSNSSSHRRARLLTVAPPLLAGFIALAMAGDANARKVHPNVGAGTIGDCLLHSDHETRESANYHGCCSKEMGICVVCNKGPRAKECYVVNYRKKGLPKVGSTGTRDGSDSGQPTGVSDSNGATTSSSGTRGGNSATIGSSGHAIGGGGCAGNVC